MNQLNLNSDEGKGRLLFVLYNNIIKLLYDASGHNADMESYFRILRMIISLLIETKPQLSPDEKDLLDRYLKKVTVLGCSIPELSSILSDVDDLSNDLSTLDIEEPLSATERERTELLSKDKVTLVDDVISLRKRVARQDSTCSDDAISEMPDGMMFYLRDRSGRTMANRTSDIDLKEENKRERKGNKSDTPLVEKNGKWESTSSNSFLQDYILIIKSMWELGMFVDYDPTIQSAGDLKKQKMAQLSSVMKAFGDAVNIKDLNKNYNTHLQKAKGGKTKIKEYDLTIFDSLKIIAEFIQDHNPIKGCSKN